MRLVRRWCGGGEEPGGGCEAEFRCEMRAMSLQVATSPNERQIGW